MSSEASTLAVAFIERFCVGDVEGIAPLLSEDFSLRGPRGHYTSKAGYLTALRRDPPDPGRASILALVEDGAEVVALYEYRRRGDSLTIAQVFEVADGRLVRSVLAFRPT